MIGVARTWAAVGAVALFALAPLGRAHAQGSAIVPPEEPPPDTSVAAAPDPSAAEAQGTSAIEAQTLFRRGLAFGDEDRWAEALELFRRSRLLVPRPNTVFNIGFALFRLGRFVQAIESFDEFLALTATETSELRVEATRRRDEAIASLASLTLEVTPESARLLVDGEESAQSGSPRVLPLDPGRHVLLASADGHEEARLEISLLAAEHATARLSLTPLEVEVEEVAPVPVVPLIEHVDLANDPVFWVMTTVLVVGAAVAIGLGATLASGGPASYGGSTGVVLLAL